MDVAIDYETRKIYKEVNDILNIMGAEYKEKIPIQIRIALKENEAKDFKTDIKKELSFYEQKISKEALAILTVLNLIYWIKNKEEKEILKTIYLANNSKYDIELSEKYSVDKIFEKKEQIQQDSYEKLKEDNKQEEKQLILVKNNIFYKIKSFFWKILKKQ